MTRPTLRPGRLQGWEYKHASTENGVLTLEIGAKPLRNQAGRFKAPPPQPTDVCKGCGEEYQRHEAQLQDFGPAKYACPCRDDWWSDSTTSPSGDRPAVCAGEKAVPSHGEQTASSPPKTTA